MEKPTYNAIDYNSKVIEERIRNYYLPVLYGRFNIEIVYFGYSIIKLQGEGLRMIWYRMPLENLEGF
jgi:hypothetical protein